MSYTKLYSTILDSSVWSCPPETRIVWMTMLAMASKDGIVHASMGGLARRANLPLKQVKAAVAELEGPDEDDKSGVMEGRRIIPMQGSWQIINFEFYREAKSLDAVRKAQWRAKKRGDTETRGPSNLDEALDMPIQDRAKALQRDPHMAQWVSPEEWPEIQQLAAAWGDKRLGTYERDTGVRNAVEVLAAGFSVDELLDAIEAAKLSGWASDKRKNGYRLGMASMTPEVVRRALDNTQNGGFKQPNTPGGYKSERVKHL